LKRAVRSALDQTWRDLEIIVVDDGSPDGTAVYLASLDEPQLRRIELRDNRGGSHARNEGIKEATGAFLAFLDDDDTWEPEKIRKQLEALEREKADLCHTGINCFNSRGRFIKYVYMTPRYDDLYKSMMNDNFFGGTSSILVRKSVAEKAGGFDTNLPALQDWDFYIRLMKAGCPVCSINEPLVRYFVDYPAHNVSLNFQRYTKAAGHMRRKYQNEPHFPLLKRRLRIIEIRRCIKSPRFFRDAFVYYCSRLFIR
jgi:glycosyltransferase involved in cell wall biosynthesis